jgi:hypothetical protein
VQPKVPPQSDPPQPTQPERRLTPLGSRVIQRRTRTRASYGVHELVPLMLVRDGLLGLGRGLGGGVSSLLRRLRLAARSPLAALPADLGGAQSGAVRIRGVVEAQVPGFETPGSHTPVLFARTLFLNQPRPGHPRSLSDEVRGVDFTLTLPSGERVELAAADVRLGARPGRIMRPNLEELGRRGGDGRQSLVPGLPAFVRETHLRQGDTVEVLGVLVRQANPGGEAFGRATPLVTRLVPATGHKWLWIERAR